MPPAARLVWLDEADARNPELVGAKAGRLAEALARGLPVLDGFVVPVEVSVPAISAGEEALRARNNSGAARTAVFNYDVRTLLSKLAPAAGKLGETLVVRSSSRAEAEGIWAGAFSSYLDLRPDEVAVGVLGCWASIFNPDTLRRGECIGESPTEIGMAALIQRRLRTVYGGMATVGDESEVTVVGTPGHPGAMATGLETGEAAVVGRDGSVHAADRPRLSPDLLRRVAVLAQQTGERTGCRHIEWAEDEKGDLYLLQAQPGPPARTRRIAPEVSRASQKADPQVRRLARMMVRYPGPVGERWVWPWGIGSDHPAPTSGRRNARPAAAIGAEIRDRAARLTSERWSGIGAGVLERAWATFGQGDPSHLLDLVRHARPVDPTEVALQSELLEELATSLATDGVIPHPGWMWYLDPDSLDEPEARKQSLTLRIGIGRWDPFIYEVIASQGETISGHPSASGWGAGRLRFVHSADDAARLSPREVVAAPQPIGNLAPLLWNAAGLITAGGSPGAHLFEVAEWLGVPAVCGVDIGRWIGKEGRKPERGHDSLVAVDGNLGRVTMLR